MNSQHALRPRGLRLVSAAAIVCALLLAAPLSYSDTDPEKRLEEIEKQIEKAAKEGKPPPPGLMEELQKIVEQMQQEDDGEDGQDGEDISDGWVEVPFTGHITITKNLQGRATMKQEGDSPGSSGGVATWSMSSRGQLKATITRCAEIRDDEGNLLGYQPVGHVTGNIIEKETFRGGSASIVSSYRAEDREEHDFDPEDIDGWCSLRVNPKEKRYAVTFPSIYLGSGAGQTVMTVREKDFQKTETEPFHGIEPGISWRGTLDRDKLKYSPHSGVVSGTETFSTNQASEMARRSLSPDNPYAAQILASINELESIGQEARGKAPGWAECVYTVSWNLRIGKPKAKVVLEPADDYSDWMPQAPMGAGNSIRIKARIEEPAGMAGRFEFKLHDVSKEPGICMNHPPNDPDDGLDLRIVPSGPGMVFAGDNQSAKTDIDVNEAMVMVQARDWGAYGKLLATATLVIGGDEVEVPAVFEDTGEPYISIPKDENCNSIADAWEEQHGVYPCAPDADDDNEPEGKYPGDGLSAYQEYRGFFVGGYHQRLNPKKKELFVYDPDGLVQQSNLAAATRLQVLYPTDKECRCDGSGGDRARVVNFNSQRYHVVDQHCLWVKKDTLPSSDPFNWGYCEGGDEIGPPRTADKYVIVYADQITEDISCGFLNNKPEISNTLAQRGIRADDAWMQGQAQEAIKMVTAHEACHGLGVTHHYKSMRHSLPKLDDIEAAILSGKIDPSFGQMSCFMRYIWDGSRHPRIAIKAEKELVELLCGRPWPNTLCGSGGFDDCRGQLVVSDAEEGFMGN